MSDYAIKRDLVSGQLEVACFPRNMDTFLQVGLPRFIGRLVGWLFGWLLGWLVGWLVGWFVGWLIDSLID